MSALFEALGQLRGERENLVARVAALDDLMKSLERYAELFGSDDRPLPTSAATPTKRIEPRTRERLLPGAQNRNEKRTEEILACLKGGPKATREIAAALKADRLVTKQALQRLKKANVITSTGSTNSQRWSLPVNGKTLATVVHKGDGPLCVRCQHRFAMHDPGNGACHAERCACKEFYA